MNEKNTFDNNQPLQNDNTQNGFGMPTQGVINNQSTNFAEQNFNTQSSNQTNPMSAVANLNKEEAMEEALSHTNQYSPFEVPKQEINFEVKKDNNKSAYIFIGIIFIIMLLFIIFLPQISKLFGW